MASFPFVFLLLLVQLSFAAAAANISCILVFGDSTVDTGNNNFVGTLFRADHAPYGVNFADGRATGRFSDGRMVPDFLAAGLGIKESVPPFLDPRLPDGELVTGVNFASAGSGFDDLTTAASGVVPVSKQVGMMKEYVGRLGKATGEARAAEIVAGALVFISAATNDFVLNFYDFPTRRLQYNISGYQDFVLKRVRETIEEIYGMGGRKFIVSGLAPIGCMPIQTKVASAHHSCVHDQNSDARVYNSKLKGVLNAVQSSLAGARIAYGNIYDAVVDMLNNPQKYGLEETSRGCCGSGYLEVGPFCNTFTPACADASKFLFWDAVHPSQSVSKMIADNFLKELIPSLY